LPKGKCDDGEKSKVTAVREVNEECNINVLLGDKLCTTWHTYEQDGKPILKRTKWYKMTCVDDSKMKPQKEENIEDIRWMDEKELQKALVNSYSSIRFVIDSLKK
jgi:8-oxo-dGTP pyrophosphatase MutT (NUDIX family)